MEYEVEITRTYWSTAVVHVQAENEQDAQDQALRLAGSGDVDWGGLHGSLDDTVSGIRETSDGDT